MAGLVYGIDGEEDDYTALKGRLANMLTIDVINPFTASRFSGLTFAAYRDVLESADPSAGLTGIGATIDGEPVGLTLARRFHDGRARLLSIYVVPSCRRRGLAGRLLDDLEENLRASGARSLEARYAADAGGVPAFDALLRRCRWPDARDYLHTFVTDGRIMSAPWFTSAVMPADFVTAPWSTVTGDERAALASASRDAGWIPPELAPHGYDSNLDPVTSLVLRRRGAIVGWVLTHPIDAATVHYANLYVQPAANRAGRTFLALALLAEAVRCQERARGITSRGRFEVAGTNTAFLKFIDRHLAPHLLSRTVHQRAVKRLV
jgi:GNAT superfamily N-acetyltransferase